MQTIEKNLTKRKQTNIFWPKIFVPITSHLRVLNQPRFSVHFPMFFCFFALRTSQPGCFSSSALWRWDWWVFTHLIENVPATTKNVSSIFRTFHVSILFYIFFFTLILSHYFFLLFSNSSWQAWQAKCRLRELIASHCCLDIGSGTHSFLDVKPRNNEYLHLGACTMCTSCLNMFWLLLLIKKIATN